MIDEDDIKRLRFRMTLISRLVLETDMMSRDWILKLIIFFLIICKARLTSR